MNVIDLHFCQDLIVKPKLKETRIMMIYLSFPFTVCYRAENNRCVFLRLDIILQGAMYIVVFTDAENMPPPYRVDNFAEVFNLEIILTF